jgi:hypothetical protein
MAYGIGSVIGDIDQKVDTYRNNPEALAQMYQQNQQLIDLLALQKLKTEKEAAMRDMQMKMQTPAASIKDQREQEVMGMMRNEVAQQVAPGLQVAGQQAAQAAAPPVPQGGGLQSLPAPNMQGMGMAEGGIVAFAGEGSSQVKSATPDRDVDNPVVGYNPDGTPITRADYERMIFALEQETEPAAKEMPERMGQAQATSGLGSLLKRAGSSIADAWREGSRIQARPYPGQREQEYVQLMENPEGRLTEAQREAQRQLQVARDMGLIPAERAQATQAAPQAAQPATPETGDTEANVIEMLGGNIRPITTQAAPQEQPQYRSRYEDQLAALETEGQDKMGALIDFLQGAGGKTSFAATMAGGGSRLRERDARLKQEKADVLKNLILDERDQQAFGLDQRRVTATERANDIQEKLGLEGLTVRKEEASIAAKAAVQRAQIEADKDASEAEQKLNADVAAAVLGSPDFIKAQKEIEDNYAGGFFSDAEPEQAQAEIDALFRTIFTRYKGRMTAASSFPAAYE